MADKLEAPVWESYDKESWRDFVWKYKTYKAKGGKPKMKTLIHDDLRGMLEEEMNDVDLSSAQLTDEVLTKKIEQLWAPHTKFRAEQELKAIKVEGDTYANLSSYCMRFKREFEQTPDTVRPPEKTAISIFTSQLKPPLLKQIIVA